jgi:ADP-ribose pyrophosphatase
VTSQGRLVPDDGAETRAVPPELCEETVASERIYEGRILNLRRDTQRLADGSEVIREVAEHAHSVVILALGAEGRIAFVRQWRSPVAGLLLELPAGVVEPGEDPVRSAARELQEEAGLKPGSLEPLPRFYVAPGWTDEYLHGFLARDCEPSQLPQDDDERVVVEHYSLGEAMDLIETGAIEDAKTIVCLQALALRAVGPLGAKVIRFYEGE